MTQSATTKATDQVVWIAGETSGDYLAALVLGELGKALDCTPQVGVGGARMCQAGLQPWYGIERLSVMGYVEVLKKLPGILALRHALITRMRAQPPRVVIGVDAPDFNLGIEEKMRACGVPTVHMVSPSIWAWRPERIHTIARAVDHMLLVFPFEEAIYKQAGIRATYIGHPLAGVIAMEPDTAQARRALAIDTRGERLFAVLPGSRASEIAGCGPIFLRACARILERTGGEGHFVIPAVDERARAQLLELAAKEERVRDKLTVVLGQSHRVLEACDGVMVASGTAALEAALFKKPMVVGYTMSGLTAWLMRKKGRIPYVSLPNILAGEMIVPEFLHYFCTPDAMAARLLDEMRPTKAAALRQRFTDMHAQLRRPTAQLATEAILATMR